MYVLHTCVKFDSGSSNNSSRIGRSGSHIDRGNRSHNISCSGCSSNIRLIGISLISDARRTEGSKVNLILP